MTFKAIIFDLDGTLLDTIEDLTDSMNFILKRSGLPTHSIDDYKYYVGDGMATLVRRALPEDKADSETANRFFLEMRQEYDKRWADKTKPYAGIKELLDGLTERKLKMAILSNKPDNFTKIVVNKFLSAWHFDAVFGERTGIPKKPDPTSALEIANLFGLHTDDFLYLGDTGTDMKTANSAGMYAVGATWGFRKVDELTENGAKAIINHPTELLRLISEI